MKKIWIFLPILAVACVGIGAVLYKPPEKETVRTTNLHARSVEQTVSCNGAVEAGEKTGVYAETACVVADVLVEEGQQVKQGDTLLRIDKQATRTAGETGAGSRLALAAMPEIVTAPRDGIVLTVNVSKGDWAADNSPCVTMAPLDGLQVRIAIREKDLRSIHAGQLVHISGDGFSSNSYEGILDSIASTARTLTASGETVVEGVVKLEPGEADASLRLGLTARAAVVTDVTGKGVVVPYEAVLEDDNGQEYVYTVENGIAMRHNIAPAAELTGGVLLADTGLDGAAVITEPSRIPADGTPINTKE